MLNCSGIPIRPLVNYISASVYKIAKEITGILKEHIPPQYKFAVRNRHELITYLKDPPIITNAAIISFHITNLYTKVRINETIDIIPHNLKQKQIKHSANI